MLQKKYLVVFAFLISCAAEAQQCPVFPYSLTNGTAADGSQVLTDLNTLRNCPALGTNPTFTGAMGIQNIAPAFALDIGSGTGAPVLRINGANSGAGKGASIYLSNAGDTTAAIGHYSAIYGTAFNDALTLYTNGANVLMPNGKVGIGTLTPSFALDVGAGSGYEILRINGGNSGASAGAALYLGNAGGTTSAIGNFSAIYETAFNDALTLYTTGANVLVPNGNVGIGTLTPNFALDVGAGSGYEIVRINGGNSGAAAGAALYFGNAGANSSAIGNYSAIYGTAFDQSLTLYTSGANVLIPNSYVGIGTTTPANRLEVAGGMSIVTPGSYDSNPGLHLFYDGSANSYIYSVQAGVAWKNLTIEGLTVTTINTSDRRMKTKVQDLTPAFGLAGIARLRPVTFHWLDRDADKENGQQVGLIAQEVEPVFPSLVKATDSNSVVTLPDGSKQAVDHVKALNYNGLIVPIVQAVKELKALFDRDHSALAKAESAIDGDHSEIIRLRAALDEKEAEINALKTQQQAQIDDLKREVSTLKLTNKASLISHSISY